MKKATLTLFWLMMLMAPALAAAQGKFTQAPAPVPMIGTCSGCARDGAQATAAENAAQASANAANAAIALTNSSLATFEGVVNSTPPSSTVAPGFIPVFSNYLGSGRAGLNAAVPVTLYTTPSAPNFATFNIERNESNISGAANDSAMTIDYTTGPNETGGEFGAQVLTSVTGTTGNNTVTGLRVVVTRQPGSNDPYIAGLFGDPDLNGLPAGTGAGQVSGGMNALELDCGGSYGDFGPNNQVWGGYGARSCVHIDVSRPLLPNVTFNGTISGTTLTLASPATLVANSTFPTSISGKNTGVASGTMIVSGSGTTYVVNNSQTVALEAMAVTPPSASFGQIAGLFFITTDLATNIESLFNFKPGTQIDNVYSCLNTVIPTGVSGPVKCLNVTSNSVIDFCADQAATPSQTQLPVCPMGYNSATGNLTYTTPAGLSWSVGNNGLMTAYFNELISGNLTLGGWEAKTVSSSVAAAGSTLATATALTSEHNKISSGAANTGVALPTGAPVGTDLWIYNRSGSTKEIWPDSASDTIESGTAGVGVIVQAGADEHFVRDTSTDWLQ